jgi:hypothetical protein
MAQSNPNAYTGHGPDGSPIQRHSCSDYYAQYGIIMAYRPVSRMHEALVKGRVIAFDRSYTGALGKAVIRVTAAPAMGGLSHVGQVLQ